MTRDLFHATLALHELLMSKSACRELLNAVRDSDGQDQRLLYDRKIEVGDRNPFFAERADLQLRFIQRYVLPDKGIVKGTKFTWVIAMKEHQQNGEVVTRFIQLKDEVRNGREILAWKPSDVMEKWKRPE